MSELLVDARVRAYLNTDGRSEQQVDGLINKYGPEVEAALEHALEAMASYLTRQFPKGLLTFKIEEE